MPRFVLHALLFALIQLALLLLGVICDAWVRAALAAG